MTDYNTLHLKLREANNKIAQLEFAADELAEAAEKAENALEVLLDTSSSLAAGTARAALRELIAARRQYEATK